MEQHVGKATKLHIQVNGADLFFTAVVTNVTPSQVSFTDKFNRNYTFLRKFVVEAVSEP